jgi:RecA/RadA recombinase
MAKFDMASIATKMQKKFEAKGSNKTRKIGVGNDLRGLTEKDFIVMPEWWKAATNTPGIPFGKIVMIAGDSDSGKTSGAIEAMKAAQAQGVGVIYVETEGKTTTKDLENWGVDPSQIFLVQSSIAEETFELLFEAWDSFKDKYPDSNLLVVFDSIGNTVSMRDTEIDLTEQNQKPGGKGQINRLGINKMIAKRDEDNVAIYMVNYTYDNLGSPGKTNAGGKAVNFFSSLTYQTSRKRWLEKTVKGVKQRVGAEVVWKLFKNHIDKSNPGPKEVILQITAEGIKFVTGSED